MQTRFEMTERTARDEIGRLEARLTDPSSEMAELRGNRRKVRATRRLASRSRRLGAATLASLLSALMVFGSSLDASSAFAQEVFEPSPIPIYVPLFDSDHLIYIYEGDGAPVNVSGLGAGWEERIYAHYADIESRPGLAALEQAAKQTVADQLGLPISKAFLNAARGQIKALVFIRLTDIINKPAADRTMAEQQVHDEVQEYITGRRTIVTNLASQQYNLWLSDPCNFEIPVGDEPNGYKDLEELDSFCGFDGIQGTFADFYGAPLAIPSEFYLRWGTILRSDAMLEYWADYYCYELNCATVEGRNQQIEIWKQRLSDGYLETERAMAFHQATGDLLSIPDFYFEDTEYTDAELISGMQEVVQGFATTYIRDFLGTVLLTTLVTGGSGSAIPDPHDLAIIATAVFVNAVFEMVGQAESRTGITDAVYRNDDSLAEIIATAAGRAELVMALEELAMPDDLRGVGAANYEDTLDGVLYTEGQQHINTITVRDWSKDFSFPAYPNALYGYNSAGLFSQFDSSARFRGHRTSIPFVDGIGDFKTAWLVSGGNPAKNQVVITDYAKRLTDSAGTPASVVVQKRFNNDCPLQGTYPFGAEPTDNGLSCVQSINGNGVRFTEGLRAGDSVIVSGRVATVKTIVSGYAFTTETEVGGGQGVPVHKIVDPAEAPLPKNDFHYLASNDDIETAIFDLEGAPPTIRLQYPVIVFEATGYQNSVDLGLVEAFDLTDGELPFTDDAPAFFELGEAIVTYTATDLEGQTTNKEQKVTVVDTTGPVFGAIPDLEAEATGVTSLIQLTIPPVTDAYSDQVSFSSDRPLVFPLGETPVTWTARDPSGNETMGVQIVRIVDTTAPEFTYVPAIVAAEATGPLTQVELGQAIATDIFGASVSVDTPNEGYPLGYTIVAWTAFDPSGNMALAFQQVLIRDTTPPIITVENPSITVEANAVDSVVDLGAVTATDLVDGSTVVSSDAPAVFPLGTTTVIHSSRDSSGNVQTATQVVTVVDTTAPEIVTAPADFSGIASGELNELDLGVFETADIFPVTVSNDAPATFPVGTTIVTWTAEDPSGNQVMTQQTVTLTYAFSGFLKPIEDGGIYKSQRVLPISFQLRFADGTLASDGIAQISVVKLSNSEVSGDPIEISTTGNADSGNSFSYLNSRYLYNLKIAADAGVYRIVVNLNDDSVHSIDIALK